MYVSLLQPGDRLPAHLHVLYEQWELRCGADRPQEPAGIRPSVSRSGHGPCAPIFQVTVSALRVVTPFPPLAEHADILLHKAFIVGIYGQIDTSSMIAESMKVLHMEAI